ncbi:MAG: hypothetical protein JWP97_5296 [Labilithrix sp.]|nr:hypothetical protein [Labilithrix sp.]
MKRSSCLAALVVVTGLTTASVASADPAQKAPKAVQPSDTQSGGGASPTAAPSSPTSTDGSPTTEAPSGAVVIGSASPGSDTPNASASEPAKANAPRRWAGTQIFAQSSMTTATVFRGQTQYDNPTVDAAAYITPRFAINDAWQLRGRVIFNYEFTNNDDTVTKHEPRFSDTTVSLFYRKLPVLPGGIKPMVSLNVAAPTSPESRARTLLFNPGLGVQLSKSIEHIPGDGELDFLVSSAYAHPVYRNTTPEIRGEAPYAFHCAGTTCGDQLSGTFNPSDTLSYALLVSATWGKWSPALYYLGASQWAYQGKEIQVNGSPVKSPEGFAPQNVRQTSYFSAWLDYEANTWLTAEVGYWLSRSILSADSTVGNPFFDRYQDMRVYIGANFNIDNILKQLEGGPTEAGIVRAQNKKPVFTF